MKCRTTTLPRKSAKLTGRPSAPCSTNPGASLSIDWKYCSRSPRAVSSSLSEWADAGTIAASDNASTNVRSDGIHSSTIRLPTGAFNKLRDRSSAALVRRGRRSPSPLIVRAPVAHHAVAVIHHLAHLLHHAHHSPIVCVFVPHHPMTHHRIGWLAVERRRRHRACDQRCSE